MKSPAEKETDGTPGIKVEDLEMTFPDPGCRLLEGPGESCTWAECMRETAAHTRYWLKNFGDEPLPSPWEERFELE